MRVDVLENLSFQGEFVREIIGNGSASLSLYRRVLRFYISGYYFVYIYISATIGHFLIFALALSALRVIWAYIRACYRDTTN